MNLGDPELELVDPTPNIHTLFIHFDRIFFWTKLASRVVVRWSKRMYSCAGICSYEGRGGLCDIALSEPLLKLRPRKDLVETLLHEMIHAFLFVSSRDQDRDGHGPNFKAHMHRINQAAGLNITIYHSFHDEVELYQTHWWRCNGPCQTRRPHFGIVRRSSNRAPGPTEHWWESHRRNCGGTFIKIKEPEKKDKKKTTSATKPKEDITKYITSQKTININNNVISSNKVQNLINNGALPPNVHTIKSILKDNTNTCGKTNGGSTVAGTQKTNNIGGNISSPQTNRPPVFAGKGQTLNDNSNKTNPKNAAEFVRNIWASKRLSTTSTEESIGKEKINNVLKPSTFKTNNVQRNGGNGATIKSNVSGKNTQKTTKPRTSSTPTNSPPAKVMRIDDYFKNAATVLKDVYGKDFNISQSESKRLVATVKTPDNVNLVADKRNNCNPNTDATPIENQVNCPICNIKVSNNEINRHLDECLNKDIVTSLSQEVMDSINNESKAFTKTTSNDVILIKTEPSTSALPVNNKPLINSSQNVNTNSPKSFKDYRNKTDGINADTIIITVQKCPCCGNTTNKELAEHFEECLAFFANTETVPEEGASTSFADNTITVEDEDDQFDESQTFNETGTKFPCPCCLEMVEELKMNEHLDFCILK